MSPCTGGRGRSWEEKGTRKAFWAGLKGSSLLLSLDMPLHLLCISHCCSMTCALWGPFLAGDMWPVWILKSTSPHLCFRSQRDSWSLMFGAKEGGLHCYTSKENHGRRVLRAECMTWRSWAGVTTLGSAKTREGHREVRQSTAKMDSRGGKLLITQRLLFLPPVLTSRVPPFGSQIPASMATK